jgi:regulator of protease activity HflC (stomatin/prohibitin superfamily)
MIDFNWGLNLTALFFLLFTIMLIIQGVRMVPQGYNWTVERFGKYTRTLVPSLHLIIPLIDKIGHKQNMMEQVLGVAPQEIISSDNAQVLTDAVCFYQVQNASQAAYEVNHLERAMQALVMTNIRAVLGAMELDDMLSNRERINTNLLTKVDEATDPWGVKITRIEIKDIAPPEDLVASMARQMKAEGEREAAIKVAEGQKQSQILKAEGELEAARRQAEARERLAEAEAKATDMVSQAIQSGYQRAINYFVAQKYIDALGKLAESENNKVMMIPLEASSVIGSIAGISDIIHSSKVGNSQSN